MEQFVRTQMLINDEIYQQIITQKILLVGIGGVGGYALESLVRFGFQNITIIDHDSIAITNLNRQILTNHSNIGIKKIDSAIQHAKDINPNINLIAYDLFLNQSNITNLNPEYDYIIDACDTITTKVELIKYALKNDIKIISCLGTGNRLDPTKLQITNIWQTNYDPLAKILRKLLKDNQIKAKIPVIWSSEIPIKTNTRQPGSISTVPAVAGIYTTSFIINDCLKKFNNIN